MTDIVDIIGGGDERMRRTVLAVLVLAVVGLAPIAAQDDANQNLNLYYRYPFAIAADFHTWTPLMDIGRTYNIIEVGGAARLPIPSAPAIQPMVRGSYVQFDSLDPLNPDQWDHTHIFGGAGVALVSRLARNFEIGLEVLGGYSQTTFPSLAAEPVGYGTLLATAAPRVTLLPSFNLAINVQPTFRYNYGLGVVDQFDGLSFSVGIGVEYRFGTDPDSPQAEIRSLRISEPDIDTIFAAMQSYYVENPVGVVTVENTESFAIEDVRVSFFQNSFMDSPTPSARIESLGAGEQIDVDLFASYNSEIFATEGITPLTGEVIVSYSSRGRPAEQRESVTYDLHDKTALTWTDDRKMGSFITPSDSAIRNYTSFVRQAGKDSVVDSASEELQIAMLAYHALIELGVIYQVDPTSPFTQVQSNTTVVDSVSLPRDTLTRLAGDCDDLTAVYATMLETVGIETAFLTTPGHIYVAFNTGVSARDYLIVHPDRDMLLIVDDRVWVPVEVTMLGSGDFLDAWRFGIDEWKKLEDTPELRGFYRTREAQSIFRPVGLRETDLGLQYGSAARIEAGFADDFSQLSSTILSEIRRTAERRGNKRAYNSLGIYAARLGRLDEAREAFEQAARLDISYIDPRVNLGSLFFLTEEYERSIRAFNQAANSIAISGEANPELETTVFINLSKAHFELGEYDDAEDFYEQAIAVDPAQAQNFAYLADPTAAAGRASEAVSGPAILFADTEEEE